MRIALGGLLVVLVVVAGVSVAWGFDQHSQAVDARAEIGQVTLQLQQARAVSRSLQTRIAGAQKQSFVPACSRTSYGADGNMGPLFCVIDNPVALAYFTKAYPKILALGRNASPQQIAQVIQQMHGQYTLPTLCSAYLLMAHRWNWSFGGSPVPGSLCEQRVMVTIR